MQSHSLNWATDMKMMTQYVLLERKIEEDNTPAEKGKRPEKLARQVFKSTQGNKNNTTHGKEQVITTEVLSPLVLLNIFFDISVH